MKNSLKRLLVIILAIAIVIPQNVVITNAASAGTTTTWTGSDGSSTDWLETDNWDQGLPQSAVDVVINGDDDNSDNNTIVIDGDDQATVYAYNLDVNTTSGAAITIELVNDPTIWVKRDFTATNLEVTGYGTIRVEDDNYESTTILDNVTIESGVELVISSGDLTAVDSDINNADVNGNVVITDSTIDYLSSEGNVTMDNSEVSVLGDINGYLNMKNSSVVGYVDSGASLTELIMADSTIEYDTYYSNYTYYYISIYSGVSGNVTMDNSTIDGEMNGISGTLTMTNGSTIGSSGLGQTGDVSGNITMSGGSSIDLIEDAAADVTLSGSSTISDIDSVGGKLTLTDSSSITASSSFTVTGDLDTTDSTVTNIKSAANITAVNSSVTMASSGTTAIVDLEDSTLSGSIYSITSTLDLDNSDVTYSGITSATVSGDIIATSGSSITAENTNLSASSNISLTGSTMTLGEDLTVDGDLTIDGTSTVDITDSDFTVKGATTNNGTFTWNGNNDFDFQGNFINNGTITADDDNSFAIDASELKLNNTGDAISVINVETTDGTTFTNTDLEFTRDDSSDMVVDGSLSLVNSSIDMTNLTYDQLDFTSHTISVDSDSEFLFTAVGKFTDASQTMLSGISEGTDLYATIIDGNINTSNAKETVTVTISSASGDTEEVTLTETGNSTGVFINSTAIEVAVDGTSTSNDGTLTITAENENITGEYVDGSETLEFPLFKDYLIWESVDNSTDWFDENNWTEGEVPDATDNVRITGDVGPALDSSIEVVNLELASTFTGSVTLDGASNIFTNVYVYGGSFSVSNEMTISGDLTIDEAESFTWITDDETDYINGSWTYLYASEIGGSITVNDTSYVSIQGNYYTDMEIGGDVTVNNSGEDNASMSLHYALVAGSADFDNISTVSVTYSDVTGDGTFDGISDLSVYDVDFDSAHSVSYTSSASIQFMETTDPKYDNIEDLTLKRSKVYGDADFTNIGDITTYYNTLGYSDGDSVTINADSGDFSDDGIYRQFDLTLSGDYTLLDSNFYADSNATINVASADINSDCQFLGTMDMDVTGAMSIYDSKIYSSANVTIDAATADIESYTTLGGTTNITATTIDFPAYSTNSNAFSSYIYFADGTITIDGTITSADRLYVGLDDVTVNFPEGSALNASTLCVYGSASSLKNVDITVPRSDYGRIYNYTNNTLTLDNSNIITEDIMMEDIYQGGTITLTNGSTITTQGRGYFGDVDGNYTTDLGEGSLYLYIWDEDHNLTTSNDTITASVYNDTGHLKDYTLTETGASTGLFTVAMDAIESSLYTIYDGRTIKYNRPDKVWTGSSDTTDSFYEPTNWNKGVIPLEYDSVTITGDTGDVDIDVVTTIKDMTIDSSYIANVSRTLGALTVDNYNQSGGTFTDSYSSSSKYIYVGEDYTQDGGANTYNGGYAYWYITGDTTITNNADVKWGRLYIQGTGDLLVDDATVASSYAQNMNQTTIQNNADVTVTSSFTNNNDLIIDNATVQLDSGSNGGNITVTTTASAVTFTDNFSNSGDFNFEAGSISANSTFTNSGSMNITEGTIYFYSLNVYEDFEMLEGTYTGRYLKVLGDLTLDEGSMDIDNYVQHNTNSSSAEDFEGSLIINDGTLSTNTLWHYSESPVTIDKGELNIDHALIISDSNSAFTLDSGNVYLGDESCYYSYYSYANSFGTLTMNGGYIEADRAAYFNGPVSINAGQVILNAYGEFDDDLTIGDYGSIDFADSVSFGGVVTSTGSYDFPYGLSTLTFTDGADVDFDGEDFEVDDFYISGTTVLRNSEITIDNESGSELYKTGTLSLVNSTIDASYARDYNVTGTTTLDDTSMLRRSATGLNIIDADYDLAPHIFEFGDDLYIKVEDESANLDTYSQEAVSVEYRNITNGDVETIAATEKDTDNDTFIGVIDSEAITSGSDPSIGDVTAEGSNGQGENIVLNFEDQLVFEYVDTRSELGLDIFSVAFNGAKLALGSADADIDSTSIDVGKCTIGEYTTSEIEIYNRGDINLEIDKIWIEDDEDGAYKFSGSGASAELLDVPIEIAPNSEETIELIFEPSTPGISTGTLKISSNDVEDEELELELTGIGGYDPEVIQEKVDEAMYSGKSDDEASLETRTIDLSELFEGKNNDDPLTLRVTGNSNIGLFETFTYDSDTSILTYKINQEDGAAEVGSATLTFEAEDTLEFSSETSVNIEIYESNNANLIKLALVDSDGDSVGDWNRAFSSETESYEIEVPVDSSTCNITAVSTNPNATVTGDGDVDVAIGQNTYTITVLSEDETTTKDYVLTVTRASAAFSADDAETVIYEAGDDARATYIDDSVTVNSAEKVVVSFTSGFLSDEDVLEYTIPSDSEVTAAYDASTGVLTITRNGVDNTSDLNSVLKSICYNNTGTTATKSTKYVSYQLYYDDAVQDSIYRTVVVNNPPTAQDSTYVVNIDDGATQLAYIVDDADDDSLTVEVVSEPYQEDDDTVVVSGDYFIYEAKDDAEGLDIFTFRAYDGYSYSDTATISINIVDNSTVGEDPEVIQDAVDAAGFSGYDYEAIAKGEYTVDVSTFFEGKNNDDPLTFTLKDNTNSDLFTTLSLSGDTLTIELNGTIGTGNVVITGTDTEWYTADATVAFEVIEDTSSEDKEDGTGDEEDGTGDEGDGTGDEGDGTGNEGDGTGDEGDGIGDEGDGTGDEEDTDGDGVNDDEDEYPNNGNKSSGEDTDGDGIDDEFDEYPDDSTKSGKDTDGDGEDDATDDDDDGDGIDDTYDSYPTDDALPSFTEVTLDTIEIYEGETYEETNSIIVNGDTVIVTGSVDTSTAGTYTVTYLVYNEDELTILTRIIEVSVAPDTTIILDDGTDEVPSEEVDSAIEGAVDGGTDEIVIEVDEEVDTDNTVVVTIVKDDVENISDNGITVIVETDNTSIEIPLDEIDIDWENANRLEIVTEKLDESATENSDMVDKVVGGASIYDGNLYDFSMILIEEDEDGNIVSETVLDDFTTEEDIVITINIGAVDSSLTLLTFYYNPDTEEWEYVIGVYDEESEEINLYTNHLSIYSVMELTVEEKQAVLLSLLNDTDNPLSLDEVLSILEDEDMDLDSDAKETYDSFSDDSKENVGQGILDNIPDEGYDMDSLNEEFVTQVEDEYVATEVLVITLNGDAKVYVDLYDTYTEKGATAIDIQDGDVTSDIIITGEVDTNAEGTYTIEYTVADADGNSSTMTRTVIVEEEDDDSDDTDDSDDDSSSSTTFISLVDNIATNIVEVTTEGTQPSKMVPLMDSFNVKEVDSDNRGEVTIEIDEDINPLLVQVYQLDDNGDWQQIFVSYTIEDGVLALDLSGDETYMVGIYEDDSNEDHWAEEAVDVMVAQGIISSAEDFDLDHKITRREFAVMVVKALKLDLLDESSGFDDVTVDDEYISTARKYRIVKGVSDTMYIPDRIINREEMTAIAMRAYNYMIEQESEPSEELFRDDDQISDWAKEIVYEAREAGMIKGRTDNMFDPSSFSANSEAATVLYNLLTIIFEGQK